MIAIGRLEWSSEFHRQFATVVKELTGRFVDFQQQHAVLGGLDGGQISNRDHIPEARLVSTANGGDGSHQSPHRLVPIVSIGNSLGGRLPGACGIGRGDDPLTVGTDFDGLPFLHEKSTILPTAVSLDGYFGRLI